VNLARSLLEQIINNWGIPEVPMNYSALILILLAGLTSAEETADGDSYHCVAERAVGFVFNNGSRKWEPGDFGISDSNYMVRPTKKDDKRYRHGPPVKEKYGVWKYGKDLGIAFCETGPTGWWLICVGLNMEFTLNVKTKRYMYVFRGSYMTATYGAIRDKEGFQIEDENGNVTYRHHEDEGGDTPYMEIGKCQSL